MKNLKRKLSVALSVLALVSMTVSCSDDDDNGGADPIIGTWNFYKYFEDNVEIPLEYCEDLETFVFSSNGNLDYEYYEEDTNSNCVLEEMISGSWENEGSSNYTINFDGETVTENISFDDNTFTVTETYTDNGMTITERYVYIRN